MQSGSKRTARKIDDVSTAVEASGCCEWYRKAMVGQGHFELPGFSGTAFLLADPARAIMLTALLDGRALPAGELAFAARVTAQTASSHLAKLLAGGLLALEIEGRHRYYRLAGSHVAQALEHLAAIRPQAPIRRRALSPEAQRLRFCRSCYDHLAGQVGVALTLALEEREYLLPVDNKGIEVTPAGSQWLAHLGIDLHGIKPSRGGLARQCLDWTERQHHIAGPLGVELMSALCGSGWLRRGRDTRVVEVLPKGRRELRSQLGVDVDHLS
ncbi:MAG TPA: helix-turn-helix transcriptional regulator [Steroidobacteraceae bacterium]|nr:helix-turn-helix transcriptional regulator [Steroidobacteraceae bacterium]